MNNNHKKSQITMLSLLLASLIIITPLLSSSLRPTYLYFVINILIIALGADAGLLSALSQQQPPEGKIPQEASTEARVNVTASPPISELKNVKAIEKSPSDHEKIPKPVKVGKVKKCPSTPSLFFIGNGGDDHTDQPADDHQAFGDEKLLCEEEDEGEEEIAEILSGQELFTKAEMFIGNFYKQLKMQREESWNRIHGFCQKAF